MKIYLVVERDPNGLTRNLQAYTSKELALKHKERLNTAERTLNIQEEIAPAIYYESYEIEEHELDAPETVQ